jgi:hypothetical protein
MKYLSRHTDLLCELETSLLMRVIQKEEMSKLGCIIHHRQNPLESTRLVDYPKILQAP